jgi:Zn-dependent metalloprotease
MRAHAAGWCPPSSLRHILPPYLLRAIARNGSPRQRESALRTLAIDQTLRALRAGPHLWTGPGLMRPASVPGPSKVRTICDAHGMQTLPGTPVRTEGAPATGDAAADEAYDGMGIAYDLFWNAFARQSIDDDGLPLQGTVHFGAGYNNAFWDGQRMVFGDGDGELFRRFTGSLDVTGHELAHGMIEDEGPLLYFFQSGALNESIADVFGSLVKQYHLRQTATQADWVIGADLFTPAVQGVGLRSMKAPGTAFNDPVLGHDPQPAHMSHFVSTYDDNGGVHINSGIPNRAFYLTAVGLGGRAWQHAGRIWYEALRDRQLRPNTGFRRFAHLTVTTAQRLYGPESIEAGHVRDAWRSVGVELTVVHDRAA